MWSPKNLWLFPHVSSRIYCCAILLLFYIWKFFLEIQISLGEDWISVSLQWFWAILYRVDIAAALYWIMRMRWGAEIVSILMAVLTCVVQVTQHLFIIKHSTCLSCAILHACIMSLTRSEQHFTCTMYMQDIIENVAHGLICLLLAMYFINKNKLHYK